MVEVRVARSTVTPVVYTDLSAGTIRLMSKEDAMLGKNHQGVMLIKQAKLDVEACKQKWDRVKIEVCPFSSSFSPLAKKGGVLGLKSNGSQVAS